MDRGPGWLQITTLLIALLGAVLGLVNTWRTISNDRVRLRVTDALAVLGTGERALAINVVNLSTFPVTITQLGLQTHAGDTHMQIPRPIFTRGETLPVRLEPRTACTVLQPVAALEQHEWLTVRSAYVSTACGLTVESKGGAILQLAFGAAAA